MLVEFSIIPIGGDLHISEEIAEAIKVLDASGLPYQVTPAATCVEGDWDDVLPVIRLCHARVRAMSPHVVTLLKIEDDQQERHKLTRNIDSVRARVGHPLNRTEPPSSAASSADIDEVKTHT